MWALRFLTGSPLNFTTLLIGTCRWIPGLCLIILMLLLSLISIRRVEVMGKALHLRLLLTGDLSFAFLSSFIQFFRSLSCWAISCFSDNIFNSDRRRPRLRFRWSWEPIVLLGTSWCRRYVKIVGLYHHRVFLPKGQYHIKNHWVVLATFHQMQLILTIFQKW